MWVPLEFKSRDFAVTLFNVVNFLLVFVTPKPLVAIIFFISILFYAFGDDEVFPQCPNLAGLSVLNRSIAPKNGISYTIVVKIDLSALFQLIS